MMPVEVSLYFHGLGSLGNTLNYSMIIAQRFIYFPSILYRKNEKTAEGRRWDPLSELEMCQPISNEAVTLALGKDVITQLWGLIFREGKIDYKLTNSTFQNKHEPAVAFVPNSFKRQKFQLMENNFTTPGDCVWPRSQFLNVSKP